MQQLLNSLLALWLIAGYAYGDQCPEFAAATHRTAVGMATEIATANGADRQRAYERYIALFHPQARVYGLVQDRPPWKTCACTIGRYSSNFRTVR